MAPTEGQDNGFLPIAEYFRILDGRIRSETQNSRSRLPLHALIQMSPLSLEASKVDFDPDQPREIILETASIYFKVRLLAHWLRQALHSQQTAFKKNHSLFLLEDPDLDILALAPPSFDPTPTLTPAPGAKPAAEQCKRRRLSHELERAVGKRKQFLVSIARIENSLNALEELAPIMEKRFGVWLTLWLTDVRESGAHDPDCLQLKDHQQWNKAFIMALRTTYWDPYEEWRAAKEAKSAVREGEAPETEGKKGDEEDRERKREGGEEDGKEELKGKGKGKEKRKEEQAEKGKGKGVLHMYVSR